MITKGSNRGDSTAKQFTGNISQKHQTVFDNYDRPKLFYLMNGIQYTVNYGKIAVMCVECVCVCVCVCRVWCVHPATP